MEQHVSSRLDVAPRTGERQAYLILCSLPLETTRRVPLPAYSHVRFTVSILFALCVVSI